VNRHLEFLLSSVFDGSELHPDHQGDLRKSGLTDETIREHKIRSVPPDMIDALLGFRAPKVRSAYVIPFPDPRGGWFDHVKLKVLSDEGSDDVRADHVEEHSEPWRYNRGQRKYLVRRASTPRLYFPIPTMTRALEGDAPLWVCEGMKKALAAMQIGLPAVGIESAWGWHVKGSRELLPDFDVVALQGRTVEIVPDSDISTNAMIERSMMQFAQALRRRGARARIVMLPTRDEVCA
jgi:uncharacterized protein DUF3854